MLLSSGDPTRIGDHSPTPVPLRVAAARPALQGLATTLANHLSPADPALQAGIRTDGRLVILLDHPASAAAWMLQTGEARDVQSALATWAAQADAALQRWRAAPDCVLLAEARISQALAAVRQRWPDRDVTTDERSPAAEDPEIDATLTALVGRAWAKLPAVAALMAALADAGLAFSDPSPRRDTTVTTPARDGDRDFDGLPAVDGHAVALLKQCLADTQQELESVHLRLHEAMSDLAARSLAIASGLRHADARLRWDDAAAREACLTLTARELEIVGVRQLPRVRASLRIASGEPELRLFAVGTEPEILSAWQPHGSVAGQAYMGFRPADDAARQALQRLGSADWHVFTSLVAMMRREAERAGDLLPRPWRMAVARLQRQLQVMPQRFRYDALHVDDAPGAGDTLRLRYAGAGFGTHRLEQVRLDWSAARLSWILDGDAIELPLATWPVGESGAPAERWTVPVGDAHLDESGKRSAWLALPDDDRALVLAVLDALPALADRCSDAQASRLGGRTALALAAAQPLREALRLLSAERHRSRLARLPGLRWLRR